MTSLNKLFTRYFIISIIIVLVIITGVSNIGGSLFFKNFIIKKNNEQNEKIVYAVNELVNSDEISIKAYPYFMSLFSRQEQVNILLFKGEELIAYSAAGSLSTRASIVKDFGGKNDYDKDQLLQRMTDTDDIKYNEYEIGLYRLSIGRAIDPFYDIANSKFLKTMNILYIVTFVIAMIIAIISAMILSRRFNRPIMQLRDNVNHISMNRYERIVSCDTKATELKELSDDINNLGAQKQNEEELRKRLSNDIVHELKTPIAVLSTNIEAILDGVYKADDERMSVLLSQTNRLARLVNNLSDLTHLETESNNAPAEAVNLSEIIESIYTVYLPAATDKDIKLEKEIEDDLIVMGNEDRLLQVFVNIVSNSLKYTDKGGRIVINACSSGDGIVCEIIDNGIGIDEKDLPFVFNRFYRGDESRSRETGGSGIGLAIAKAVVSSHGGEIKINSTKGDGTKVSIYFEKFNGTA